MRNSSGESLAGMYIRVRSGRRPAIGNFLNRETRTGTDGRFKLDGLPEKDLAIEAYGHGYLLKSVTPSEMDHSDLTITLQRAGKAAGRVVDGVTGKPLDKFTIRFVIGPLSANERRALGIAASWFREGHIFTETDGYWSSGYEWMEPGTVLSIEARAEGYASTQVDHVGVEVDPAPDNCVIKMFRGGKIEGRVVDADSQPVNGAKVTVRSPGDEDIRPSTEPYEGGATKTDGSGSFRLDKVAPGQRILIIQPPNRPQFRDGPFLVPVTGDAVYRLIILPRGGRIWGRLLHADGTPRPSEAVYLFPVARTMSEIYEMEKTTGSDGQFEFSGLPKGRFKITHVIKEGKESVHAFSTHVMLEESESLGIDLRPTGSCTLSGHVSMESGGPVPSLVCITVKSIVGSGIHRERGIPDRGTFARNGRFKMAGLVPGEYLVSVHFFRRLMRVVGSAQATLRDGENSEVEVRLKEISLRPRRR